MDKNLVRKKILELRCNIKDEEKIEWDQLIFASLVKSDFFIKAKKIFIYVSYKNEVDTKKIIQYSLKNKKEIYVPKTYLNEKNMKAVKINSLDELIVDNYGILEPKYVDKNNIGNNFDLIIMPGVAFDRCGNRIGYGGGYYDKYLLNIKEDIKKIALAYDIQVIDDIHREKHDIKVDCIITEKEIVVL